MKSITVLLVGQVRNQHVLLRMVENLAAFRNKGLVNQVILSTWTGEIPKIRHLLPRLEAAGVTVKWVDEPVANRSAPGNIVNQMRGVDLALETVEDTAPSVPTMLRQATPGSLPLRAEVKASNGYAPSRLR
jgi:hypothetical protein